MQPEINLPWTKINDFLLSVSKAQTSKELYTETLNRIGELVLFDAGHLYILNEQLIPEVRVLINVRSSFIDDYINYYRMIQGERFSYVNSPPAFIDWQNVESCEFKTDYINPQKIHSSATLIFYGKDRWPKATIAIHRTGKYGFTSTDRKALKLIRLHLTNLHGIFMNAVDQRQPHHNCVDILKSLTKREAEIVDLLAKGMSPAQISKRKFISPHTVYNHMANIYKKTNVSNQRELLSKVMRATL